MKVWADLHSHLYGCLQPEDVAWLAQRKHKMPDAIASEESMERLANSYQIREKLPISKFGAPSFTIFQDRFDELIRLSTFSEEEIAGIVERVVAHEEADYAEYRFMIPLGKSDSFIKSRLRAMDEACRSAALRYQKQICSILSLPRNPQAAWKTYQILRNECNEGRLGTFVGLDFCGQEEGFPPSLLSGLLKKMREDKPQIRPLPVYYHVGEFYNDKSVESAVRWVVEAHDAGSDRLGHAVALGIKPETYQNTKRVESLEEHLPHLKFLLHHQESLAEFGLHGASEWQREMEQLVCRSQSFAKQAQADKKISNFVEEKVHIQYDDRRVENLRRLQDWAMWYLKQKNAIVECMLTSNERLTAISSLAEHPILRFLANGLRCVLATDDRGIFTTSLSQEFRRAKEEVGLSDSQLEMLAWQASKSC